MGDMLEKVYVRVCTCVYKEAGHQNAEKRRRSPKKRR